MMKWIRLFAIFLNCFAAVFCNAAPALRHKKLLPLDPKAVNETIKELKQTRVECALGFGLSTKKDRKTETKEGRCYFRKNSDGAYLLLKFGDQVFLSFGPPNGEIFCSDPSKKITPNDPVQSDHLLCFSDILMLFLEWDSYEYLHPERVQGRNTHIFRFKTTGQVVEIAYDPVYGIILQVKYFDEKGKLLRIFNLLDLKKVQDTWFIKSIEVRDVPSNVTTQLMVKEVALEQPIPTDIFDKNALGKPFVDRLVYTSL
ncbi:MAG: outer membrane lipoprotein-sorting protein [Puniceicoccales bacterium]|jgi:hypothetical protein|nr:outer membrane lipoprotein-sorting protein [Puniceicoccales bacterium]